LFFSTDLKHSNAGYAYPKSNLASSKKTQYSISRNVIQKRKGKSNKDKNHSETTETNETKGGGGGDEGILLNNVHKKSDDEISYHP
jgi:hypothetical protein